MATEIRANEKQPDCHKIDRSSVISKYVGETEKRLNKVFLKAWPKNLMLFFDEADVVFGKRSTVNDVSDRDVNRYRRKTSFFRNSS
jgi:SpoVK/Ycf46/Vps4 family AAA+-type ATPase